jgi:uncharacterized membrane protein
MSEECVVAVFDDLKHAQEAVHILDRGEFPTVQVSLVTKGLKEQPEIVEDLEMGDDSVRDAAVGGGLGAIVGVLAGIAVMVVSGLGAVFLAGPIGGAIVGAATGAFLGGLGGWGVHEKRIRHYEQLVKKGKVLVIAHGNPLELVQADRILREMDPAEIHVYARTSSEAPEI